MSGSVGVVSVDGHGLVLRMPGGFSGLWLLLPTRRPLGGAGNLQSVPNGRQL